MPPVPGVLGACATRSAVLPQDTGRALCGNMLGADTSGRNLTFEILDDVSRVSNVTFAPLGPDRLQERIANPIYLTTAQIGVHWQAQNTCTQHFSTWQAAFGRVGRERGMFVQGL